MNTLLLIVTLYALYFLLSGALLMIRDKQIEWKQRTQRGGTRDNKR